MARFGLLMDVRLNRGLIWCGWLGLVCSGAFGHLLAGDAGELASRVFVELPGEAHASDEIALLGGFRLVNEQGPTAVSRDELAALDGFAERRVRILPGLPELRLGTLPLSALLTHFPAMARMDGLLLETINGWESFVTFDHIRANDSQLLLFVEGRRPSEGGWPFFGGDIEPLAPFYVFDATEPIPTFPSSPAFGMIAATQITGISAVNSRVRYEPFFAGRLARIPTIAEQGRALFLQRCNGCHKGPGGVGGDVAGRPYPVLQAHARHNETYFRSVVRDPKAVFPDTAMPRHADFEEADLEALIAFLTIEL